MRCVRERGRRSMGEEREGKGEREKGTDRGSGTVILVLENFISDIKNLIK